MILHGKRNILSHCTYCHNYTAAVRTSYWYMWLLIYYQISPLIKKHIQRKLEGEYSSSTLLAIGPWSDQHQFSPNWISRSSRVQVQSSNIFTQILQTDLYTFLHWISWENMKNNQSIFPLVIILSILITSSLDCVLII